MLSKNVLLQLLPWSWSRRAVSRRDDPIIFVSTAIFLARPNNGKNLACTAVHGVVLEMSQKPCRCGRASFPFSCHRSGSLSPCFACLHQRKHHCRSIRSVVQQRILVQLLLLHTATTLFYFISPRRSSTHNTHTHHKNAAQQSLDEKARRCQWDDPQKDCH